MTWRLGVNGQQLGRKAAVGGNRWQEVGLPAIIVK